MIASSFLTRFPAQCVATPSRELEQAFRLRLEAQHGWQFDNSWPTEPKPCTTLARVKRRDLLQGAAALLFVRDALAQGRLEKGVYRLRGDVHVNGANAQQGGELRPGDTRAHAAGRRDRLRRAARRVPGAAELRGLAGGERACAW